MAALGRLRPLMAALLLHAPCGAVGAGLADPRIVGALPAIPLDGQWKASSATGLSIDATVPGDIITDLQRAGEIGDPLYELNWKDPKNVRLWNQTWTYTRTLPPATSSLVKHAAGAGEVLLVFDGIKMGATIKLNGKTLGMATDQFVKYQLRIYIFIIYMEIELHTNQSLLHTVYFIRAAGTTFQSPSTFWRPPTATGCRRWRCPSTGRRTGASWHAQEGGTGGRTRSAQHHKHMHVRYLFVCRICM